MELHKWGDRHFWAREYFVSTVGNVNEETIRKYIQEQEENDKLEDGKKYAFNYLYKPDKKDI